MDVNVSNFKTASSTHVLYVGQLGTAVEICFGHRAPPDFIVLTLFLFMWYSE